MTTMIEDAVKQLKAGIDQTRAAQRRLYASGQAVLVRSTVWTVNGPKTTWSHGTVVAGVNNGKAWVYRIRQTDSRGLHTYRITGRGNIRNA